MKFVPFVIGCALLFGCARTPPYQQLVTADTPVNFAMWRAENSDSLTPKEWMLFDQAMTALKLKIMMEGQASGSEAIDQAMRTKIDGVQLGEVILSGLRIRLKRMQADKTILEESLLANSRLKLRPGNEEKAPALAAMIREQTERLEKMKTTVGEAEADLHEFERKIDQAKPKNTKTG